MEVRRRLRPSAEQYRSFGDYLADAHSWYKHLPLMCGRRFVVFVAPDAGIGRLVAVPQGASPETATRYSLETPPEGPAFTDEHPRLHYGWKTTNEYRSRFGYLDYMCRGGPDELYDRDAGPPVELPDEVEERCGFVLYPYVSGMFADAVTWDIHQEAIQLLRNGVAHPSRDRVLELASLAAELNDAWYALDHKERDWVIQKDKQLRDAPSTGVRRYRELNESVVTVCGLLQKQEVDKIQRALAELDYWMLRG